MAFSTSYANFGALQFSSSEMITTTFQDDAFDLAAQLQTYCQDDNTFFDPSTDFLYQENYTGLLPYFCTPQAESALPFSSPDIFTCEDFELTKCLKRHKCYDYRHYDLGSYKASPFYGYAYENLSPSAAPELLPDSLIAPLRFQVPQVFYTEKSVKSASKSSDNGVSAQSIAARQRRKKITEKTLELSKLIPGGSKMNTAEMLQAAFKYVKFMQAQVGILESMVSFQEGQNPNYDLEKDEAKRKLQALVTSPTIQEKLYSKEKCLVPTSFVKVLAKDHDLQSIPSA